VDRVFLSPESRTGDRFVVEGAERRHLADALRVRPGETFLATDGTGREYLLEAVTVDKRSLVAAVREDRAGAPEPGQHVTLAIAPPKGTRMETAVEKAVECGVGRIVPLRTERSVVKSTEGTERLERWRRVARSALAQSGRCRLPEVTEPATLADVLGGAGLRLLAHLDAEARPLRDVLDGAGPAGEAAGSIVLLVGPEGGFSDAEAEEARRSGAIAVSLGGTRLRTETAAIVAVALTVDHARRMA
jgi:16S rRNA (uracil1498-N3)-methyltransferase